MNQNYCLIEKNKIYGELFDELLEEELSMNKQEDNDKIKRYIGNKIISNNYIKISEVFTTQDDIMSDIINKITENTDNKNLQGNTVILYADDNNMYEAFHMEDLTHTLELSDNDLNEYSSLSNIHLLPIYWGCGIFKSSYNDGKIIGNIINKEDIIKIYNENYYHKGVLINTNGQMQEIEFTGENPSKVIGMGFVCSNPTDIIGFSILPFIEKNNTDDKNIIASKLFKRNINGRVFLGLLCPTTNKKYWSIHIETINNILKIMNDETKMNNIYQEIDSDNKYINPFYLLKKHIE